jgi:thiosulfate reductase cytochrome b subunit
MARSTLVRVTHWVNSLSFFALAISGIAILIAHPRLYWGETGSVGTPSLIDLPIPFRLGHSGWGRYLHFLAAWICVLNGLIYLISGLRARHFSRGFEDYKPLQRGAYSAVVLVVFPLTILTGFAMSPAITSVVPELVEGFGGQQSARTLHFFAACILVIFFFGHVAMVWRAGFVHSVRAMIAGEA